MGGGRDFTVLKSCVFSVSVHSASEGGERTIFRADISWSYRLASQGKKGGCHWIDYSVRKLDSVLCASCGVLCTTYPFERKERKKGDKAYSKHRKQHVCFLFCFYFMHSVGFVFLFLML